MTSTNYLSPTDFKKMIDAVPLVTEYNKSKLLGYSKEKVPDPENIQAALWVQYCCGLRISEVISLEPDDFNFERKILTLNRTKTGFKKKDGIKVRKKQFTSIPPDFPKWLESRILNSHLDILFPHNRQLMWSYVKKACKMANLELGEQQDERYIEGAWTHLIRKSRAKMMIEKGAPEVMVKVKLRHTFSVTERYTKPDINGLIKWEHDNL